MKKTSDAEALSRRGAGGRRRNASLPISVLAAASLASAARADLVVPAVFGHNMVIQADAAVAVWGTARPGEVVTVAIAGRTASATAGTNGSWRATLAPLPAGGPHVLTIRGESGTLSFTNVMVGEVWFCGGQSNMEWPLPKTRDGAATIASADHPDIRFFRVPKKPAKEPQADCNGQWQVCSPATAGALSGAGYYFGRELQARLKVPVGLIVCAWSGAAIESFLALDTLAEHPVLRKKITEHEEYRTTEYPARLRAYQDWEREARQEKASGKVPPPEPRRPKDPDGPERGLCNLYNGMVAPVLPYTIRGITWYQGENNIGNTDEYRALFPLLIRDWRRRWRQGDFPFLFVQVSSIGQPSDQPSDDGWCRIRDSQLAGLGETNTAMVTTMDIGDGSLHPANKRDVGLRLALTARAVAYGEKNLVCMGPLFAGVTFEGSAAVIRFTHTGAGLEAKGGAPLKGFTMAGADRKFAKAAARIDGDTAIVSCAEIPAPVAVRYGWAGSPDCNLYNRDGLPASPFRTDDWPLSTSP
jgi:sialate O-acetylesterase